MTVHTESRHLFTEREKWNKLLTLQIGDYNVLGLGSECLASLQNLEIYKVEGDLTIQRCWPHLQTIKSDSSALLFEVAEGVEKGLFPSLKTVRDASFDRSSGFKFHKANIAYIPDST